MNIKLLGNNIDCPPKVKVCLNRKVPPDQIKDYLHGYYNHINPPTAFNIALLKDGAKKLIKCIQTNSTAFVVVDCDCDGYTSAAIMINYLYYAFPTWASNNLFYGLHNGKQHGLADMMENIYDTIPPWGTDNLVICPDSASNDISYIEDLYGNNIETLILDHHITEEFSKTATTINSQYDYPNAELSGAGVTWQFCRFLDALLGTGYSQALLDLVAVGTQGDMMSMLSLETKELIFLGLQHDNIRNPLIHGLTEKNAFSLSKSDYLPSKDNKLAYTPMGISFFVVPLLNAICRSGTLEEKNLVFSAMLSAKAFKEVPSTKRGSKPGDTERVLDQALRCCTNVKNRQTRFEEAGLALLESKVHDKLDDKVLVFCLEPGEIDSNIAGLTANKMMARYQRPVCVLTHVGNEYMGSMRGYTKTGLNDFKTVAETSPQCKWSKGHANAAGLCITEDVSGFINDMNVALKDISTDIVYYVDYKFNAARIDPEVILDLADMNDYLGQDFERPQVYIEEVELDSLKIMKSNTLKLSTPAGVDLIIFGATDEEIEKLSAGNNQINAVCKCAKNEWNGVIKPQLIVTDYEIVPIKKILQWGF